MLHGGQAQGGGRPYPGPELTAASRGGSPQHREPHASAGCAFGYLAIWAAKRARGRPYGLMVLLVVIAAVASALLDNVTTAAITHSDRIRRPLRRESAPNCRMGIPIDLVAI